MPYRKRCLLLAVLTVLVAACGRQAAGSGTSVVSTPTGGSSRQAAPVTLNVFAAGTLANPLNKVDDVFASKYPNVTVHAQFGGSVKEVKQVTQLGKRADVVGVADYSVIPKYMFGGNGKQTYAKWYVGFASNAITFVYTDKSEGASDITPQNWYKVLARPGVHIGRSNPDTDPSGYQTLQMLKLAEKYYRDPGLSGAILKNAPKKYMRDTETELLGALESGDIDYLAIYESSAKQHDLKSIHLPSAINLSDPSQANKYAEVSVHTANGDLEARPIIYALTVPTNAEQKRWAEKYIAFVLGPKGQEIMKSSGFEVVSPALAYNRDELPAELRKLTAEWKGK